MSPSLGIIEGYCGNPWSWQERRDTVAFLAGHGYGFFIYGPKADNFLRRRWREEHPPELFAPLAEFAADCRRLGVRFGIGLTPYELYTGFDAEARTALAAKLAHLETLDLDIVAVLFDDMKGDLPGLAGAQAEIVHFIAERTRARHILMCPTYYSDDPELERYFGQRPANFLADLGKALDPRIDVFWTGEEICARELTVGHLARIGEQLRRKPFLWDNYPANDGKRMSRFIHLRGFTGRPAAIGDHIAGHAINPAMQPFLTRVPALTLVESYARGDAYEYVAAFRRAAATACGEELARMLHEDLFRLNDIALERLGDISAKLRARYEPIDHPAAREVIGWLDGKFSSAWEMG